MTDKILGSIYPLVNNTGAFSINGYLYAYISGVILMGVPNTLSQYDNITGCPYEFFIHDVSHVRAQYRLNMFDDDFINKYSKPVYYTILNSNLSRNKKEYLLFILWVCVHEIFTTYIEDFIKGNTDNHDEYLSHKTWFDVKEEDYEDMLQYMVGPYEGRTLERYRNDQDMRFYSLPIFYNEFLGEKLPHLYQRDPRIRVMPPPIRRRRKGMSATSYI